MPRDTCDPAPNEFNKTVLSKDDGRVTFTCRWRWDGVSVQPNCQGPIEDVRVQNTGPNTWELSLPNSTTQKTRLLVPGEDRTFTGQQLAGIGLLKVSDIEGVVMTQVA